MTSLRSLSALCLATSALFWPIPNASAHPTTGELSEPVPAAGQGQRQGPPRAARQGRGDGGYDRLFANESNVAAGRAGIEAMQRATGTAAWIEDEGGLVQVPVWESLPGLRYQLLETTWIAEQRSSDRFRVHHRLPRLVHLMPETGGYVLTEVVYSSDDGEDYRASYQRVIVDGPISWTELDQRYEREGENKARMLIAREHLFGTLPLCLSDLRAEVAEVRVGGDLDCYAFRLRRPSLLGSTETVSELALYLDPETNLPVRWQFQTDDAIRVESDLVSLVEIKEMREVPLSDAVRAEVEERLVKAWRKARIAAWRADNGADAEPPAELVQAVPDAATVHVPESFMTPYRQLMSTDTSAVLKEFVYEEPVLVELPEGAFDRPWLTNVVWQSPVRADFWDPPAEGTPQEGE